MGVSREILQEKYFAYGLSEFLESQLRVLNIFRAV